MATCKSIRDFHNQLCGVIGAFDAIHRVAVDRHEDTLSYLMEPALLLFRDLMNSADDLCGPDERS